MITATQGFNTTSGRFSNGTVWNEYLFADQQRGTTFKIFGTKRDGDFGAQSNNGNINVNYSVGGTTYLLNSTLYVPTINEEIDYFINGTNTISRESIVGLWSGANDALAVLTEGASPTEKAAAVKEKFSEALERLYQAGGRQFLTPDLPDFAKVPRFNTLDSPLPHATSEAFNAAYLDAIAEFKNKHPDATVYAPKMNDLLNTVMRYPELFGYKNVTEACINNAECANSETGSTYQNQYMFWDTIHPTTGTHEYIANYMREYWLNPDLAGFYVTSRKDQFKTERNFFFPTTDKIVTGYLSGDKALYKLKDAKLTLTGDHSYTGGTFIETGELELGNGGLTGSVIGDVSTKANSVLSFNRGNILSFDGVITGAGNVGQKGTGLTILNGNNTYSGKTDITAGELMVNGSVTSQVIAHSGGTISGTGSIGNLLAESGSFIFPDDFRKSETNIFTVNGNADLLQGSTLGIRVDPNGNTSVLDVHGTATLGGSVIFSGNQRGVRLSVDETLALLGETNTFLKYETRSGEFETVEPTYKFFGASLGYGPHQADVTFTLNNSRFADDATTVNERAVANAAQDLGLHNQLYDNIITSTFDDDLSTVYSELTGDIYASLQTSLLFDNNLIRDAVQQRMADVFAGRISPPDDSDGSLSNGTWGQVYNSDTNWGGDGNANGMKRSLTGFITGIDMSAEDWQLGIFAGFMDSSINSGSSSASISTYHLGAYGGREWDDLKLSFGASASLHDIETSRLFDFKEINNSNQADYRGNSFQTFAELSYDFETPLAQVSPFAQLSYTRVNTHAFAEKQSATALSGGSSKASSIGTLLGLRLSQNYKLSDDTDIDLTLMSGWQHNSQTLPIADLNFVGGKSFKNSGLPMVRDALVVRTGVQLNLQKNMSLDLSYKGQFGNKLKDHTVKANFTISF